MTAAAAISSLLVPLPAGGEQPFATLLLWLAVVMVAAKAGGELAVRLRQPAVLGELAAGVLLGNLPLVGFHRLEPIAGDPIIQALAQLGVVLLLFEVGLESTVAQMVKVGASSLMVALVGVVAPFALGWLVASWFLPAASGLARAFVGATLCATSVGITARVLKDLDRARTVEARIILGAAVIDDVLGLVILSVVVGAVHAADAGGAPSWGGVLLMLLKAAAFLVGALIFGVLLSGRLVRRSARLEAGGALLAVGLTGCFLLAWLAHVAGLAPIVGAFAAGLVLEDADYQAFTARGERGLEELLHPLSSFLVPIFFVTTGMRTDLAALAGGRALLFAAVLSLAAVGGKLLSSLGALRAADGGEAGRRLDRLSIGIGMIPRGEVGLIFANIGATLTLHGQPLLAPGVFSAMVSMVMLTTLLAPPLLERSLRRGARAPA